MDLERRASSIRAGRQTMVFPAYQQLYSGDEGALYSPDPSGRRFLILTGRAEGHTGTDRISVVVNWFSELRQRF